MDKKYPFEFEEDSRPRENKDVYLGYLGYFEKIYCISCGVPGGVVSKDLPGVIYLCDDCEKFGDLPLVKMTDEAQEKFIKKEEELFALLSKK